MAVVVNPLVTVHPHAAYPSQSLQRPLPDEQQSITQHLQLICHILQQRAVQLLSEEQSAGAMNAPGAADTGQAPSLHANVSADGRPHATLPTLQLSASQYAARHNALQVLQTYIEQGQYPAARSSDVEAGVDTLPARLPVFIDRVSGVHCAVGHLMAATGHRQLAASIDQVAHTAHIHQLIDVQQQLDTVAQQQLSASQNRQLTTLHAFTRWQQSVGLTLDELAWIQPTYSYRRKRAAERLDSAAIQRVASLQQPDGNFANQNMAALAAALQVPMLTKVASTWQQSGKPIELQHFTQLHIAAALELRVGLLPEMLAIARNANYYLHGRYPHYVAADNPLACSVLRSLYQWLADAAQATDPSDAARLSTANFNTQLHQARDWAIHFVSEVSDRRMGESQAEYLQRVSVMTR